MMRISLAAAGLTALAVGLIFWSHEPRSYWVYGLAIVVGIAAMVRAVVNRKAATRTRILAFCLGAVPVALALYVIAAIAYAIHSGGFE